jgi:hypothetical protein
MNTQEIYDKLMLLQRENPMAIEALEMRPFAKDGISLRGMIWSLGMEELNKEFKQHFMLDGDRLIVG